MNNSDFFSWLRRGFSGNELLQKAFNDARPDFERRRVSDLSITVTADKSAPDRYALAITNRGTQTYKALRVHYEPLLLHAESFGLDTTHMPADQAWIAGEPMIVDTLEPGTTARMVRKGFGSHDRFDGLRETVMDLEYRLGLKTVSSREQRWAEVTVDLPNATSA